MFLPFFNPLGLGFEPVTPNYQDRNPVHRLFIFSKKCHNKFRINPQIGIHGQKCIF